MAYPLPPRYGDQKITRDAFLYLTPPAMENAEFAQCSTCSMWVEGDNKCTIHSPVIRVPGTASCGFYLHGKPNPAGTPAEQIVTPTESGLVDREVRCENCRWGGPEVYRCSLFFQLNAVLPRIFNLDTGINPKGCCNAQEPRK